MTCRHIQGGHTDGRSGVGFAALLAVMAMMLALTPLALHAQSPTMRPLKLFVFAYQDPSGFTDTETRTRQKVASDLASRLKKKPKVFDVVPTAAEAEATLEVTDIVSGEQQNNAFWIGIAGIGNIPHSRRAVFTMGTYRTGFAARTRYAGEGLAKVALDWAKMNRERLATR